MTEALRFMAILTALGLPQFTNEIVWIARAVQGETGSLFIDNREISAMITHTILNRATSIDFPSRPEIIVRQGFYGYKLVKDPDASHYDLALQAALQYILSGDITDGALYMLSYHDMTRMDIPHVVGKCYDADADGYGLCFFKKWPGECNDDIDD